MAPVVPVVAVLLIRPFSRGGVVAITARAAICVSMWTSIAIVILVAMRVVWMMPVSLPRLVAVAGVTVFSVPLPVSSICDEIRKKLMSDDQCLIYLEADNINSALKTITKKSTRTIAPEVSLVNCIVWFSVVSVRALLSRVRCRFGGRLRTR